MPTILYPVMVWGLRLATKGAIEVAIRNGALKTTSEAVDRILKMLVSNTVVMALNVGVIIWKPTPSYAQCAISNSPPLINA